MSRTRVGLIALLIALLSASAWVRLDSRLREGRDLKPRPDALEYGFTAERIAAGSDYRLAVDGVLYPPRYPPGFPFMAAPVLRAIDGDAFDTWKASFLYALLSIALTALIAHLLAGPIAAIAAGAVMCCSPAHVISSGLAMSETAFSALIAAALLLACVAIRGRAERPRRILLIGAGLAIGGAFSIRYTGLAFLLPILLLLGTRHRLAPTGKALPVALVLLPTLAVVATILAYNAQTFGDFLRDGYHFWVPALYGTEFCFDASYISQAGPLAPWNEGNLRVYSEVLLGLRGDMVSWPIALIAVIGTVWVLAQARRCVIARLLALTTFVALPAIFAFHLIYYWQDARFLLPFLPVVAVLVGAGARAGADLIGKAARQRDAWLISSMITVGLAIQLGWPVLTSKDVEIPPLVDRLEVLDADLERDSMVIVNFPLSIANALIGRDRTVLVDDQNSSDPHLSAIATYALPSFESKSSDASYLAANGNPVQTRILEIEGRVRSGRPVYVIVADHEAGEGPGIAALRSRFEFQDRFFRKPVTVYQLQPR